MRCGRGVGILAFKLLKLAGPSQAGMRPALPCRDSEITRNARRQVFQSTKLNFKVVSHVSDVKMRCSFSREGIH